MKGFFIKELLMSVVALSALGLVGCLKENVTTSTPRIVSVSPNVGELNALPGSMTFVVGGDNLLPLQDITRSRVLESHNALLGEVSADPTWDSVINFVSSKMSSEGTNIIKWHDDGNSFIEVDSSSECAPTLTLDKANLNVVQNFFDREPLSFSDNLSGDSCSGKKLVLKFYTTSINTIDFGNLGQNPQCNMLVQKGADQVCLRFSPLLEYYLQKFTFTIGDGANLSAACQAINNIGTFNLSGNSQSKEDAVAAIDSDETVGVTYTRLSSGGGEQAIIRWLTSGGADINPAIASATASGNVTGAVQPGNAARLRTYIVSGNWNIKYTCSKN